MTLDPTKEADVKSRLSVAKLKENSIEVKTDLKTAPSASSARRVAGDSQPQDRIKALQDLIQERKKGEFDGVDGRSSNPVSRNFRSSEAWGGTGDGGKVLRRQALQSLQHAHSSSRLAKRKAIWRFLFFALAGTLALSRRLISPVITALVSFGAWVLLLMIYYSVREHI